MLKKRDAQGLPIQVIILVVIGLIVLFVVITIFGRESGRTVKTLESCESRGGNCVSEDSCNDGTKIPNICPKGSDGKDKICCVTIN